MRSTDGRKVSLWVNVVPRNLTGSVEMFGLQNLIIEIIQDPQVDVAIVQHALTPFLFAVAQGCNLSICEMGVTFRSATREIRYYSLSL